MQIILFSQSSSSKIINIFYGENDTYVNNWIKEYIQDYTNTHSNNPTIEITQDNNHDKYTVYHTVKKIVPGYIFNTHTTNIEELFSIQILDYDETQFINTISSENSMLWKDINQIVNNKVLKQLDQDSLYQVFLKMGASIHTKLSWTATELIQLQNQILKDFKKDLYSSVVKKLKRFGPKPKTTPTCTIQYHSKKID